MGAHGGGDGAKADHPALIENSIYHGIRDKAGHSTIKIKIGARDGWVAITVLDNGLGMDRERLEQLKKRLEGEDTQEGVHIGLLNTHKRLELIYGGDYKIRLLSRPGRGTMIELKIRGPATGRARRRNVIRPSARRGVNRSGKITGLKSSSGSRRFEIMGKTAGNMKQIVVK